MLGQNSTHANFSVNDLDAARRFYVDKLGFMLKYEQNGLMILESGAGTKVGVYYKADHKAWDSTVMGIEVDDVKKTVDELRQIDVMIEPLEGTNADGIMSDPVYGDAAWFKDPAGNWICIEHFGS